MQICGGCFGYGSCWEEGRGTESSPLNVQLRESPDSQEFTPDELRKLGAYNRMTGDFTIKDKSDLKALLSMNPMAQKMGCPSSFFSLGTNIRNANDWGLLPHKADITIKEVGFELFREETMKLSANIQLDDCWAGEKNYENSRLVRYGALVKSGTDVTVKVDSDLSSESDVMLQ